MTREMRRWLVLTCLVVFGMALASGCGNVPEEGDPCMGPEDNICESGSGPGLYSCSSGTAYEYLRCSTVCVDGGFSRWNGDCGTGSDDWDVCFCIR